MSNCTCYIEHMRAKAPWTCSCKCHDKKGPEIEPERVYSQSEVDEILADREERIRQRDGEWVDAIEDTLHFGIIPETLAGAIECMKAWLEEREERIRVLEATKEEEIANVHMSYQTGKEYELLVSAQVDMLTKAYRAQVTDLQARIERAKVRLEQLKLDCCTDDADHGGQIHDPDTYELVDELLAALDEDTKERE
jgi:hypothetical protein